MPHQFTTCGAAELFGIVEWRVRRLFELGMIPEPPRFAGKRAIPREMLPQIIDAPRARGWLPEADSPKPEGATVMPNEPS